MAMISIDPKTSALVFIDLQKGVVGMPVAPHSSQDVVARARKLAEKFRAAGAPVVWVRVAFAEDFADAPGQAVDEPMRLAPGALPPGSSDLVEGLASPGDLVVVKRQWGAFYGTELDLQLRRRGVKTMVLGGVSTNFGVESTVRQAWELGYELLVVEDACASRSAEMHDFAITSIFPRLTRVVRCADLVLPA
jgi:nicotinamidase-related amidase